MKQRLRLGQNHRLIRRNKAAPATAKIRAEMNMKVKWITLALALALAAGTTLAHGNKVHIRGKIEKVGADSLQVKSADGKTVEVNLVASTVYIQHRAAKPGDPAGTNDNRPAKLADLAVGDAVVIHATPKDGNLEADEVKFSAPESNKVASAGAKPKS
jgi:hypothetical protein